MKEDESKISLREEKEKGLMEKQPLPEVVKILEVEEDVGKNEVAKGETERKKDLFETINPWLETEIKLEKITVDEDNCKAMKADEDVHHENAEIEADEISSTEEEWTDGEEETDRRVRSGLASSLLSEPSSSFLTTADLNLLLSFVSSLSWWWWSVLLSPSVELSSLGSPLIFSRSLR